MTDTVSKKKRSEIMRAVKSRDSEIEVKFRRAIWKAGFRYRKSPAKYFGKPDLVLKKYKTVVFIDSCFWHGCKRHCRLPSSNKKYWVEKIERNKKRDREVSQYYRKLGWKVVRVWEHDIQSNSKISKDYLEK